MSDRVEKYCEWKICLAESTYYGETPNGGEDAIIKLLINDGQLERGQRENLFSNKHHFVGIGVAPHNDYDQVLVINYAGDIVPYDEPDEVHFRETWVPEHSYYQIKKSSAEDEKDEDEVGSSRLKVPRRASKKRSSQNVTRSSRKEYYTYNDLPSEAKSRFYGLKVGRDNRFKKTGDDKFEVDYLSPFRERKTFLNEITETSSSSPGSYYDNHDRSHSGAKRKSFSKSTKSIDGKITEESRAEYEHPDRTTETVTETITKTESYY